MHLFPVTTYVVSAEVEPLLIVDIGQSRCSNTFCAHQTFILVDCAQNGGHSNRNAWLSNDLSTTQFDTFLKFELFSLNSKVIFRKAYANTGCACKCCGDPVLTTLGIPGCLAVR